MSDRTPPGVVLEQVQNLIATRRTQDAARVAFEAHALDPEDAMVRGAVGWAVLADGQPDVARSWLEWSLAADPHQGWVHDLRARAILQGAGEPREAIEAAAAAIHEDPEDPDALMTMVRASLTSGDRVGAAHAAAALRRVAPASILAPLAGAYLALDRGGVYRRRTYGLALVVITFVTRGGALLVIGAWWAVHAVRRAPHLREADALVREALHRDPTSGEARLLLADVLRLRFRFASAVEGDVATQAIDAGLVDAADLAGSIARRTAIAGLAAAVTWFFVVTLTAAAGASEDVVVGIGLGVAAGGLAGLVVFEGWQTASLPRLVRARVAGDIWPALLGLAVTTATGAWGAQAIWGEGADPSSRPVFLAALLVTPLVAAATVARGVGVLRATRRTAV